MSHRALGPQFDEHGRRYEFSTGVGVNYVGAYQDDQRLGEMHWDQDKVRFVGVYEEQHLRQGLARGMWNAANAFHAADPESIPPPRHSDDRSKAGDAWARRVGGDLPPRRKKRR
jgi:hypothetical protein